MNVIVVLPGVVEEARVSKERAPDHVLDRPSIELGAFHQVVRIVHVSEVMLVVVEFQCLAGQVRGERMIRDT